MDALAILVHERNLSTTSATADPPFKGGSCATLVPPSATQTAGFSRRQPESGAAFGGSRKPLWQARFGSVSGGGGIRTHETPV
jgi:hypothetical protein